jgi:hypothetical protein
MMNKSCLRAVLVVICVLSAFLTTATGESRQTARIPRCETISWDPSLTLPPDPYPSLPKLLANAAGCRKILSWRGVLRLVNFHIIYVL